MSNRARILLGLLAVAVVAAVACAVFLAPMGDVPVTLVEDDGRGGDRPNPSSVTEQGAAIGLRGPETEGKDSTDDRTGRPVDNEHADAAHGVKERIVALEKQGAVIITVLDKNGNPLRDFHCNLKAVNVYEGQDFFSGPLVSKQIKGARNGTVRIECVHALTFVAEVLAAGHAKNFSERFTITENMSAPRRVTVRLNMGGSIVGRVVDVTGKGVSGVAVKTRPQGAIDNPFVQAFGGFPFAISRSQTKTDADGRFALDLLCTGQYQLFFMHADFCSTLRDDITVTTGNKTKLDDIRMITGCVVSGVARIGGKLAGDVRVEFAPVPDTSNPLAPTALALFRCGATTDKNGRYQLPRRMNPGMYRVSWVRTNSHFFAQTFGRECTIPPRREHCRIDVGSK